jgi:hypothetical protein
MPGFKSEREIPPIPSTVNTRRAPCNAGIRNEFRVPPFP